ncbi:MAG TPA: FecR domain-containing protein [Prolixibacteraceae bacterium]|nr:FecR domain-containing protein [Prolixibacteraceae bacterium]
MNPTTDHYHLLIARYLTDELTESEHAELEAWKFRNQENMHEYNDFVAIWSKAETLKMPSVIRQPDILNTLYKKSEKLQARKRWMQWALQSAAVVALAVIFSSLYIYLDRTQSATVHQSVYQEVKAAYGTQARVELADGTSVSLNSGSKLRFPQSFDHQQQRRVILEGEGFFTVTKNEKLPFVVETSLLDIQVLGTSFNVDAYPDNQSVLIALVEGKVKLQNNTGKENKDLMELLPNEVATLNRAERTLIKTSSPDLYKYTAWVNGRIVFFEDPIQTVLKKLEKWYNVEIVISDQRLKNYKFTGTFINESLEQVLSILSLTSPMTYEIQPSVKQADQSMSKRKITLKSRS